MNENKKAAKQQYERINRIRIKLKNNEPTTFAERNILKIYEKKIAKSKDK